MRVKFTVPGEPKGKGRPRVEKNGNFAHARTPEDTVIYENLVKTSYYQQCKNMKFEKGIPLDVRITAYYTIPQSTSMKKQRLMLEKAIRPMKKPDADNVVKIILDSINKIAYYDDAQVVDCQFRKFYSNEPRVVVTIQEAKILNTCC